MHIIPDELMRWIGGGGDQLGQYAGKMGEGSQGSLAAVASFTAGRGLTQSMQNGARQLGDIGKNFKTKKDNEANEAKNKDFQGLKNRKEFDGLKAGMDKSLGGGGGDQVASMMGITADNIDSFESQEKMHHLTNAVNSLEPHGEDAGAAFLGAMQTSAGEGFASYGGAKEAVSEISKGIVTNSLLAHATEQFGEGAGDYIRSVANNETGGIDNGKAVKAVSDLKKASAALGPQFKDVFNKAVSENPNDGPAMMAHMAKAYGVVSVAKKKEVEPEEAPKDIQEE